jgi:hypothetical protein
MTKREMVISTDLKWFRLGDEDIHKPPKQQGTTNHYQKKRNEVADLGFSFASADD